MKHLAHAPAFRRFAFAALLSSAPLSAQTTVTLSAGASSTSYSTTAPNSPTTFHLESGSTTLSGVISGTGGVIKTGAGAITLSGLNTYTGTTTLNGGALHLVGGFNTSGNIIVNSGGTLVFNRQDIFVNHSGADPNARLTINQGGVVTNGNFFNTLHNLTLNGGELRASGGETSVWTAYYLKGTVTVGGTAPSVISTTGAPNSEIQIGNNFIGGGTTFQVADVTGSAAADLTISATLQNGRDFEQNATASSLIKTGAGTLVLTGANTYTGTTTISAGTVRVGDGGTTGSLLGSIVNRSALVFNRSDTTTFSGAISGTGTLTQAGAGKLVLGGTVTHTGGTTISTGTLQIGDGGTSGSISGNIVNNAALIFNRSDGSMAAGNISGSGTLTKQGAGVLTLSGTNSYTGVTLVSAGTLLFNQRASLYNDTPANWTANNLIVSPGATLALAIGGTNGFSSANLTQIASLASATGGFQSGSNLGIDTTGATGGYAMPGALANPNGGANALGLTKLGTGTLTLSTNNSYTGATTVAAGTLALSGSSTFTGGSALIVNSGAFFNLAGYSDAISSLSGAGTVSLSAGTLTVGSSNTSTTFSGGISGTGGVIKTGTGTLTLSGAQTYSGPTTVNAGTLSLANAFDSGGTGGSSIAVNNGGTLQIWAGNIFGAHMANPSTRLTIGAGGLVVNNAGYNTFVNLTLNGGELRAAGGESSTWPSYQLKGTVTVGGTTPSLISTTGAANSQIHLGNNAAHGATTFQVDNVTNDSGADLTISAVLQDGRDGAGASVASGLTKTGTGTLVLTGANTYTGTTTISAGRLVLGAANAVPAASTLAVDAGATYDLAGFSSTVGGISGSGTIDLVTGALSVGANNAATTFSGVITGSGGFNKVGTGTLFLDGASTYTGATTLSDGTTIFASPSVLYGGGGITSWTAPDLFTVAPGATAAFLMGGTGGSTAGDIDIIKVLGSATSGFRSGSILGLDTTQAGGGGFVYSGSIANTNSDNNVLGFTKLGAGTLTLSGINTYTGATTVAAGTLGLIGTAALPASTALIVNSGATFDTSGLAVSIGSLSGAGSVVTGSQAITVGSANMASTFSGVISGTGGLNKIGTGTLTLSGVNTYSGTTTISAGALALGGSNRISDTSAFVIEAGGQFNLASASETIAGLSGAGRVSLGSGTLTIATNESLDPFSGVIEGSGSLTKTGTGTLALSGANPFTGGLTVSGGTLLITGTLANNSATTISGGILRVGAGGALSAASALNLGAGGTLDLAGASTTIASLSGSGTVTLGVAELTLGSNTSSTFSGTIDGIGGLTKLGTGTLTLSGTNTYIGRTTISAGTVRFTRPAAFAAETPSSLTVAPGATATYNVGGAGEFTSEQIATIASFGTANGGFQSGATLALDTTNASGGFLVSHIYNINALNLIKLGAGTLTLSGTNVYGGATTVSTGTLALGSSAALPANTALTLNSGTTLDMRGHAASIGSLTGAGNILTNTQSITVGSANLANTFSGVISGTGGLVKVGTGTLTLSASNTYTGATTISGGTLALSGSNRIADTSVLVVETDGRLNLANASETIGGLSGAGRVSLGSGTLTIATNASLAPFSGVIEGTGNLTKTGSGTLELSGTNTFTGALNLSAGTLLLSGTLANNGTTTISSGTLRLGTGGALSATSALHLGASGTLDLDGNSSTLTSITGSGSVALGSGVLTLNSNTSTTFSANMSGTGGFTKLGTGTLTLAGTNTYSGPTTLSAGALHFTRTAAFSGGTPATWTAESLTVASGATASFNVGGTGEFTSAQIAALASLGTATAGFQNGATIALDTTNASGGFTVGGINNPNALNLTKLGVGTLTLSGSNSYGGVTTVSAGTLVLGTADALPAGATLNVASGADLILGANQAISTSTRLTITSGSTLHLGGYAASIRSFSTGANIGLSGSSELTVGADGGSAFLSGVITGTGSLIKAGAGTFTLSNGSSRFGNATVNDGTLALTALLGPSAATSFVVNSGGTLRLQVQDIFGSHTTNPAARFTINEGGLVTNGNTYNTLVDLTLNGGELRASGGESLTWPAYQLKGTVTVGGTTASTISTTGADYSQIHLGYPLGGKTTFNVADATGNAAADLVVSAVLTNGRSSFNSEVSTALEKTGAGTLLLSGNNLYTGSTTISAGTLRIGAGGETGSVAGPIANAGALIFDRSNTLSINGVISGSGSLTQAGSGTLVLGGANTYTGATTIAGGTLEVAGNGNLGAASTSLIFDGGTLATTGSFTLSRPLTFSANGGGFAPSSATTLTVSSGISDAGALMKSGLGTLVLSGANTFAGPVSVNAGTLVLQGGAAIADSVAVSLTNATLTLGSSETIGSLAGSGTVTLGSNTLTTGGNGTSTAFSGALNGTGALVKNGGGTLALSGTSNYSGGTLLNAGTIAISADANLGAANGPVAFSGGTLATFGTFAATRATTLTAEGGTFNIAAGTALTWEGAIQGAGSLTKDGTGNLLLGGSNSYSGITYINAGTLTITSPNALSPNTTLQIAAGAHFDSGTFQQTFADLTGTGTIYVGSGGLLVQTGGNTTFNGTLVGTVNGAFTMNGSGTLSLRGSNSYNGTTRITSGTLTIDADTRLGLAPTSASASHLQISGGTLATTESLTLAANRGILLGSGGGTLEVASATTLTYGGIIAGSTALTKTGAGTLVLSGANTHSGGTVISAGILQIGSGGNSGSISGSITNNGALIANRSDTFELAGAIGGSGGLFQAGTGNLIVSGNNSYSGGTTVQSGTLTLGHSSALGSGLVNIASGATLSLGAAGFDLGRVSGNGQVTSALPYVFSASDTTLAVTLGGTASLQKTNPGTLTLTNGNNYSGGTLLSAGTIAVGNNTALGTGSVELAGGSLQASGGARTLANAFTLSGDTTFGGTQALTLTGPLTLTRNRELTVTNTALTRITGVIGESGLGRTLAKYGEGTLELTGANTYSGGTFIGEGTVRINNTTGSAFGSGAVTVASGATLTGGGSFTGALQLNGTFSPGNSPGLATIGSGSFLAGTTLMELAGLGRGTTYDAINVSGAGVLSFGGTLSVSLLNGFTPTAGSSFDLFNFTTGTGTFSTLSLPTLAPGLEWNTAALYSTGVLSVAISAIPEPSTYALISGLALLGCALWRRTKAKTKS